MSDPEITDPRDPYKRRVSAGPYTLDLPENGVALLYENGTQLPGGVGYLSALIEFAGEVIRLNAEIVALRQRLDIARAYVIPNERAEALEEATVVCLRKARDYVIPIGQDNHHDGCIACAAAIRALKAQP